MKLLWRPGDSGPMKRRGGLYDCKFNEVWWEELLSIVECTDEPPSGELNWAEEFKCVIWAWEPILPAPFNDITQSPGLVSDGIPTPVLGRPRSRSTPAHSSSLILEWDRNPLCREERISRLFKEPVLTREFPVLRERARVTWRWPAPALCSFILLSCLNIWHELETFMFNIVYFERLISISKVDKLE